MAKLMIVESPNKVKKIQSILGNDWIVQASVGHIRDLPRRDYGIGPDYSLHYEPTERGTSVIPKLKSFVSRADSVYLATDPDREGEAIAWHLKEALKLRSYSRVTFDSITEPVIKKAIASPRQIDGALVASQEARRGTDRIVGWKVSNALSRGMGIAKLSAGRVQTVAVRLVVERQREIDAFKKTKHFGAEVVFDGGAWKAQWDTKPYLAQDQEYILDQRIAEEAAACRQFKVTQSDTKHATKAPPAPFTTATLLQAASVTLNMKPATTADVAQSLFSQGLITYHRTDSPNFSEEALSLIRGYAKDNNLPLAPKPRTWKTKESAQEAHEAIRPTHLEQRTAGETKEEQLLYSLIWHRAVASQLADAEYTVNTLQLESENAGRRFAFRAVGRTLIKPGWRSLTSKDATEDVDAGDENAEEKAAEDNGKVPLLSVGTARTADSGKVLDKETRPPNGYTQASLIKKLEAEGIGRPSTYAGILTNILTRGYVDEKKKILVPLPLGIGIIDALVGKFAFTEYAYTRDLEEQLDHIAAGKSRFDDLIRSFDQQIDKELTTAVIEKRPDLGGSDRTFGAGGASAADDGIPCPKCGKGKVRQPKGQSFYGCNRYSEGCDFKINETISKKKLTQKQIETLVLKGRVGPLKGFRSGENKEYEATLKCSAETGWRTIFEYPKR
jgi:DNA topoisomerase-1